MKNEEVALKQAITNLEKAAKDYHEADSKLRNLSHEIMKSLGCTDKYSETWAARGEATKMLKAALYNLVSAKAWE